RDSPGRALYGLAVSRITSTHDLWLAAYLVAHGLTFRRATALDGPHFRVRFSFDDPNGRAPSLTRRFRHDIAMQRLVSSRRVLSEALAIVRSRGACEAADV